MFEADPKTLTDTRIQLHWASQLLAAGADAKLDKAEDDSQSNFAWNAESNCLESRIGCNLNVEKFTIEHEGESLELSETTLEQAVNWLSKRLGVDIKFRDYEMPAHPVRDGDFFSPNKSHLSAIAQWFTFGQNALESCGKLRVWPHHFDLGFWTSGEIDGKSIGGGFSLGDGYFDQPYFYINPYGVERPDTLPELEYGHWTQHWFGAVLTANELSLFPNPEEGSADFVSSTFKASQRLLSLEQSSL